MKKISVPKYTWRKLSEIKRVKNLASFSKVIGYLILKGETSPKTHALNHGENSKHSRRKDISEIRKHIDMLKPIKNLEENLIRKQSSVIIRCMRCNHLFKLDEIIPDESGIVCPGCSSQYELFLEENENKKELIKNE